MVQESNATITHTSQPGQQFEITRVRALETGRSIPVASPNGLSGVIAPDGSVIAVAERKAQQVLVEEVPLSTTLTPAVRMGAWPGRLLLSLSLAGVIAGLLLRRRDRRPSSGRPAVLREHPATPDGPGAPGERGRTAAVSSSVRTEPSVPGGRASGDADDERSR